MENQNKKEEWINNKEEKDRDMKNRNRKGKDGGEGDDFK